MTGLLRQLKAWQRREWFYTAAVVLASWILFVCLGLVFTCTADYIADAYGETPYWFRVILTVGQAILYTVVAVVVFLLIRPPSVVQLAGRAERVFPEFDHRLVTALQLNQAHAKTDGMSAQLIADVSTEAETLSARHRLTALADANRLWIALCILVPVIIVAGFFLVFFNTLTVAMLKRQALQDVDIPRSVNLENITPGLFPSGDPLNLRIRVVGPVSESTRGTVMLSPDGGGAEEQYALSFAERIDETTTIFVAELPPFSEPFHFRATLRDGRMRTPAAVEFRPRPVVTGVEAWVLSPAYVDPEGKRRYEKLGNQGDVTCHPDCSIRVVTPISKPVKAATLVLFGKGIEKKIEMGLNSDATEATATFDLLPGANTYRIEVTDEHGFGNLTPPRRSLNLLPDRPPNVALNDEVLMPGYETGPLDDYEVRGMPLVLGGQIQIGYTARSPLGLAKASVVYRVNEGNWTALPMAQVDADETKVGKFRLDLGVFSSYDVDKNVEFYPLPSVDVDAEAPGLVAGGRYNFQTAALSKIREGLPTKLEIGDRVEFRVAVFDRKPDRLIPPNETELANRPADQRMGLGRPAGYSESRIKAVVTQAAFDQWRDQQARSRERLREIEKLQRGVFGQPENDK